MQGEADRSFEVLPSTCEMLGHARYSCFHITVLLDRSTDGSGTRNSQNGSDSRSHSSGVLAGSGRCCAFHRAL